jgi:hypothetical protein
VADELTPRVSISLDPRLFENLDEIIRDGFAPYDFIGWARRANLAFEFDPAATGRPVVAGRDKLVARDVRRETPSLFDHKHDGDRWIASMALVPLQGEPKAVEEPLEFRREMAGHGWESLKERVEAALHLSGLSDAPAPDAPTAWLTARARAAFVIEQWDEVRHNGQQVSRFETLDLLSAAAAFGYAVRSAELADKERLAKSGQASARAGGAGGRKSGDTRRSKPRRRHAEVLVREALASGHDSSPTIIARYVYDNWWTEGPERKFPEFSSSQLLDIIKAILSDRH